MNMNQSLLGQQAFAGYSGATAPPAFPTGNSAATAEELDSMVRDKRDPIEMVRGGLVELGVPSGLARVVAEDDYRIGLRMYLLDNSGSTNQGDGHVVTEVNGRIVSRPGTRWEEICSFAEDHARWNLRIGTPCEFVILNSFRAPGQPMQDGRDCLHVDRHLGLEQDQVDRLRSFLRNHAPRGCTPISERLEEIRQRVQAQLPSLAQRNQMVFLTIVTDGLPTSPMSGESTPADKAMMVQMLRTLCTTLPMQLVIRLCTDEDATVDFYNKIDEELELPLDILDDICGEAQEIAKRGNDFFAYTPILHRIREAGTMSKVLDNIDERRLTPQEARSLAELLSGRPDSLDHLSKAKFIEEMARIAARAPLVYDARRQATAPFVNILKLRVAMKCGLRGTLLPMICPCLF